MRGIEVGPSYRPICPKSGGWSILVVDHANRESLIEKYEKWNVDTTSIESVDVVLDDRGLDGIDQEQQYDFLIASHVIEHAPDPIRFLLSAARLLKAGAVLRLAVPDKRFCFDILKPTSTAGQLVQAYVEGRTRHSLGQVLDALMLHVVRDGQIVFPDIGPDDRLAFAHPALEAYSMATRITAAGTYHDVHGWVYTPASFAAVWGHLAAIGLFPFRIRQIIPDGRHEFLVEALREDPEIVVDQQNAINLLKAAILEQAEPLRSRNSQP